ncbi:helix-turn-helix domain-containing protein [Antrihabitans sp. YC3-6]|uniref:Helix-turn-helix domain-containing protein n=1 Tax=Antrihabitans stalagmiti TaxID=2799499 RepID=A0A934NMQ1_9NOCA|nr:LuxR C-terminal-related transcriptional regulator [Antrihabitans stalagmiti]MBJ8338081.1 helix-turn-helix domain-containing protein [Antrihabitans stalagmiti]
MTETLSTATKHATSHLIEDMMDSPGSDDMWRRNSGPLLERRIKQLTTGARSEIFGMLPDTSQSKQLFSSNTAQAELARTRGVVTRTVFPAAFTRDPVSLCAIRKRTRLGGGSRTFPEVPFPLVVVDRTVVLVPANPDRPEMDLLEVRDPALVGTMAALLERFWKQSTKIESNPADQLAFSERELELVLLLQAGYTDEATARRLGVSPRTVRRMTADLMQRLGARSRFEAGIKVAQLGLV